uniref:Uncharacterized protein n=1 Tax=Odontella aurita TaxID=265563 RepID=A0A7S4J780_9STRA|mmetsp:Transcript_40461/g.121909  ORF Transcript_40461/g.121909 Transcript_40461/m.121909 type:complete len:761 (+) Transcript_40461:232-2514(+)
MSSSSPPLLAASCGPLVAVWDCSASTSSSSVPDPIDLDSAPESPASTDDGIVRIFRPHGGPPSSGAGSDAALHVSDLAWNHSGQIVATCSSSPRAPSARSSAVGVEDNVVLTHAATGSALESFSNFHPSSRSSFSKSSGKHGDSSPSSEAATSIGFGGKSRYICVSDVAGSVSIWDMKKRSRVRNYRLPPPPSSGGKQTCPAACIDPTDTIVAALSGCPSDGALRLYRLREGKLASTLRDSAANGGSHGGATALHFSSLIKEHCAVGSRDGTVLVWDVAAVVTSNASGGGSSSVLASPSGKAAATEYSEPHSSLTGRHSAAITGVAFSPVNRLLLATSSLDGTVAFHDVNSRKTIQTVRAPAPPNAVGRSPGVSCVAFHSDGVTCAAGTDAGSALLYDLRKAGTGPLSTLTFSRTGGEAVPPVAAVKFADRAGTGRTARTPRADRKAEGGSSGTSSGKATASAPASTATAVPAPAPAVTSSGVGAVASLAAVPATPMRTDIAATSSVDESVDDEDDALSPMSRAKRLIANSARKAAASSSAAAIARSSHMVAGAGTADLNSAAAAAAAPPLPPSYSTVPVAASSPASVKLPPPPSATPSEETAAELADSSVVEGARSHLASPAAEQEVSRLVDEAAPVSPAPGAVVPGTPGTVQAAAPLAAEEADDYVVVNSHSSSLPSPDVRVNKLVLQSMLDDAVDILRDDVEDAVRNLHVDVLRQFQDLSDEMRVMIDNQNEAMTKIVEENRSLREENDHLRGKGRI